jgi:hypothetical protein
MSESKKTEDMAQSGARLMGWLYQFKDEKPIFFTDRREWIKSHTLWKETPLYALSPPTREEGVKGND